MIRTLILFLLVAGCSSKSSGSSSPGPPSTPSGSSPSSGPVSQTPPGAASSQPSPGSPPQPSPPCGTGTVTKTAKKGEVPEPLCQVVGAMLRVSAEPSPRQPWMPLTSSDQAVLECTSRPAPGGSIDAMCTAVRPGSATVSTVTSPFAGDPHGRPQFRWAVRVRVVQAPW